LFDRFVALIGLLMLSPFLVTVAAAVGLTSPGPVLFLQTRVGKGGRLFRLVKFRTMQVADDEPGRRQVTVAGDSRITPVGAWLRRYKLDEIAQLVNVLIGQMRLVGPRPEVPRYVAHYTDDQRRVLDCTPGITDVATLYYRNEDEELAGRDDPEGYYIGTILPQKLELNRRYIDHRGFISDIVVILRTALVSVSPGWGGARVRRSIARRYLSGEA